MLWTLECPLTSSLTQKYKCDDLKSYERVELLAVDSH